MQSTHAVAGFKSISALPLPHAMHAVVPAVLTLPATHEMHGVEGSESSSTVPARQSAHETEPGAVYVPGEQGTHAVAELPSRSA